MTARSFRFGEVTASLAMLTALTWLAPNLVAATAVALRATNRAMQDRTLATERCRFNLLTV